MQVLRHPSFRNLFFGQAASAIGDRIVYVALALYVTDIGSPSDVGLVLAAHALPMVGFLLLGGVWADRLSRTRVMISTDLVRFVLHALLAALIFTGAVEIWHIVVIEALFGTAEAFFRPALTGLVPQTVPEDEIQPARAAAEPAVAARSPLLERPPLPVARWRGGGGGPEHCDDRLWLWPLPPPGPIRVVCHWPFFGVDAATALIAGEAIAAAAGRAELLWVDDRPLPPTEDALVL